MLEKLFTSKNRIKILSFFLFENQESYIREISRELNVPVSAVKKEIDNLSSIGILNKDKRKISLNNKCNYLEDLKNIFIKTDSIIYPIKEALKSNKIKYAFLFGSFARGDYQEESDVDLMIIGDIKLSEVINFINPVDDNIKRNINPVVWTTETLINEKNSGFIKDIFKKGIIMIKGDKNELRKIIE
mgnify:FL=1